MYYAAQKMKFSIKDLFSKYDQIHSFLWIWSHELKKSLMENFSYCAVLPIMALKDLFLEKDLYHLISSSEKFRNSILSKNILWPMYQSLSKNQINSF